MHLKPIISYISHYVPRNIISNSNLPYSKRVENADAVQKVLHSIGIHERRYVSDGENSYTMASEVAKNLLSHFSKDGELCSLIFSSLTPSTYFPSTATQLFSQFYDQYDNFIPNNMYDLSNSCPGGILAIKNTVNDITLGEYRHGMVIASDAMSLMTFKSAKTGGLFGDASAGMIISQGFSSEYGFIDSKFTVVPQNLDKLCYYTNLCGSINNEENGFTMNGKYVYDTGVSTTVNFLLEFMKENNLEINEVDYIISHQANGKMLNEIANGLNLGEGKMLSNIKNFGNTASASPLLVLSQQASRFKKGDKIILCSFGAGFTIGALYYIRTGLEKWK